ncbi:MAG: TetR/AcrR family transcriptional regulator [Deltaproteobacteria bacterium]|nr:TetR/AcrR family transcriptional regulator [Deltaproteobacteria bacterium]
MEGRKLSRRQRERQTQRQEMLAAALELFSEKGYHNVSMHEIAARSEFAIGTLYKFFTGKEDLYKALIREKCERFHQVLTEAIEGAGDEVERLRRYIEVKGAVFRDNVPSIRLYLAETRGASFNIMAGLDREIRERYAQFLDSLAGVFESGFRNGLFRPIGRSFHLAVALDSLCNAFLVLWLEDPEKHPYPEDPDTILNLLFEGLLSTSEGRGGDRRFESH